MRIRSESDTVGESRSTFEYLRARYERRSRPRCRTCRLTVESALGTSDPEEQLVRQTNRIALIAAALGIALVAGAGCKGEDKEAAAAAAEKAAQEKAAADLKQPVAVIAAYLPYLKPAPSTDKYIPKRRPDEDRATTFVAEEIRHAANKARQTLSGDSPVVKDLVAALTPITASCASVEDPEAAGKCEATVKALDEALKKAEGASNGAVKFPRIAPESVTPEAKKEIEPFLRAKGPGPAGKTYAEKRADPKAAFADVASACQAAQDEASDAAAAFEKAAEPLRLIGVTRKMSMESQCTGLNAVEQLRKDVNDCRKKAKSTECKVTCSKAKAKVEDGVPAAVLSPLEKDVAEICKE